MCRVDNQTEMANHFNESFCDIGQIGQSLVSKVSYIDISISDEIS